jgi:hypothetical protein
MTGLKSSLVQQVTWLVFTAAPMCSPAIAAVCTCANASWLHLTSPAGLPAEHQLPSKRDGARLLESAVLQGLVVCALTIKEFSYSRSPAGPTQFQRLLRRLCAALH